MSRENDAAQYPYAIDGAMAGDGVYYAEEAYGINKTAGWISSSGKLAYRIPDTLSGKIFYPVYYGAKTIKEKGVYIEDVTSESENTYPKDGISGSYYYVFKYAVPGVPSITVPGAAMIGHAVDISWEAADSAESYKLERRVDSGGWTQVYAGDDLTYTDTVQSGWTSVQYRISAGISGVYGGLTVSNVVSIIPVSSLVISGTDGNLGTAKAPVTYSVTSDTDSPITVTEIINGHERTLTPTSGQLITIPVSMLDPGAGAITIKASVQAASGAVNQTRNWTYTKTPLALPVDPYRVERMQGKECDVMPQTLAEAVMMPDGSSVADKLGVALEGAAIGTFTSSVTLPFTPDAVWVVCGYSATNVAAKSSMLYPDIDVYIQVDFGSSNTDVIKWDGNTKISASGKYPYRYVALKFGGGGS